MGRRTHLAGIEHARRETAAGPSAASTPRPSSARTRARPRPSSRAMSPQARSRRPRSSRPSKCLRAIRCSRVDREVASAAAHAVQQFRRPRDIEREVEQRLKDGFRTFKIKVGKSAEDDARRVKLIQRAIAGRATMRLDANRAYSEADACRFAMALDPAGIELFEQPCPAEDWEANAKVASVSPVPVMLDEPICELADVKRASAIANVGFCKLKLKRFGGLDLLREALDAVREWGMEAVLGDGLSSRAWVLDGGLCRARHHSQCRRIQRISETECTGCSRSLCGSWRVN